MEDTKELVQPDSASDDSGSTIDLSPNNEEVTLPTQEQLSAEQAETSTSPAGKTTARENPPEGHSLARGKISVKNSSAPRSQNPKDATTRATSPVEKSALRSKKATVGRISVEKNQRTAKFAPTLNAALDKPQRASAGPRSAKRTPVQKLSSSPRTRRKASSRSKSPAPQKQKETELLKPSPSRRSTQLKSIQSHTSARNIRRASRIDKPRPNNFLFTPKVTNKAVPKRIAKEVSLMGIVEFEHEQADASSSESETLTVWTTTDPPGLLAIAAAIPRLSEMSEYHSSSSMIETTVDAVDAFEGTFVDPITGTSPSESATLKKPKKKKILQEEENIDEQTKVAEEIAEEEFEEEASEDPIVQQLADGDVAFDLTIPKPAHKIGAEHVLKQLTELEVDEDDVHFVPEDIGELKKAMRQEIAQFLDDLMNAAAATAEENFFTTQLRKRLDKHKVLAELESHVRLLDMEQAQSAFLNRKVVEYHRRKRMLRPITVDNPTTISSDIEKYKESINHLNILLGDEVERKQVAEKSLDQLNWQHQNAEEEASAAIFRFEELMRTKIAREGFRKLPEMIEKYLKIMSSERNEISKERFRLINIQHTESTLKVKLDKKYDLGNGLHLLSYERLQTDVQGLNKKIEERHGDLTRHGKNCGSHIHMICHVKEKIQMQRDLIEIQTDSLDELKDTGESLRAYINELKMRRTKLRNEINDTSFQGGLVDKPSLMYDYDKTVENIEEMRSRVEELKNHIHVINNKIKQIDSSVALRDTPVPKGSPKPNVFESVLGKSKEPYSDL